VSVGPAVDPPASRPVQAAPHTAQRPRLPRLLRPLARRDFRLLYLGLTVSLAGDGIYLVAIAWLVYDLSGAPAALAAVGVAWTLPQVLLLMVGGLLSDRWDRRRVLIVADVVRGLAVALLGVAALAGVLHLWEVAALVAVLGVGDALFLPAVTAIVPSLVPDEEIVEANALDRLVQPLCLRFIGPALGGVLIAVLGAGEAFLIDAASFALSALAVARITRRPPPARASGTDVRAELAEGWAFVRAHRWLWVTLASAAAALLAFFGPVQVLVPYLVRHRLHEGAGAFGAILAAGGIGAMVASVLLGQFGLPRRRVTFMYAAWSVSCLALAFYAVASSEALFMVAGAVAGAGTTAGMVVWGTLMQRLVPGPLLGRVSSLDWTVSTALVPVSFALTAPLADVVGPTATLAIAGLSSAAITVACLFVPGVRDPERA
jgi:predicted MFS family arabinose efflux permease